MICAVKLFSLDLLAGSCTLFHLKSGLYDTPSQSSVFLDIFSTKQSGTSTGASTNRNQKARERRSCVAAAMAIWQRRKGVGDGGRLRGGDPREGRCVAAAMAIWQ